MNSRYKNVETGMKYIVEIADMYGLSRRAVSKRLEVAGIKGVLIGRRAYYQMSKELNGVLSKPNPRNKANKKEKNIPKPLSQPTQGSYILLDELSDVCVTVKSN